MVQIVEHAINCCVEACHFLDFIKDETTGQDAQKHFLNTVGARVVETMWRSDEEDGLSEDDHDEQDDHDEHDEHDEHDDHDERDEHDDSEHDTESDEEFSEPPPKFTCAGAKALELVGKARAKVVPAIRSDAVLTVDSDSDADSARPSKKARV